MHLLRQISPPLWRVVSCLALCVPQLAHAGLITYSFDTVVSGAFFGPTVPGGLPVELHDPLSLVGERFSGTIAVNDLARDFDSDPMRGSYSSDAVPRFSIFLGGGEFFVEPNVPGAVTASGLSVSTGDFQRGTVLSFFGFSPRGSLAGSPSFQLNMNLIYFGDGSLLDSDAVPSDLTLLPDTFELSLSLSNPDAGEGLTFQGRTRLTRTAVMEPASAAVFGVGLLACVWAVRRRRAGASVAEFLVRDGETHELPLPHT